MPRTLSRISPPAVLAGTVLALGVLIAAAAGPAAAARAADGVIAKQSRFSVEETTERLTSALKSAGITVFQVIDHSAGADRAGLHLRPTRLVIFGNPRLGTPLMQAAASMAIDLPQKAVIVEDEAGAVRLLYNDPVYLADRHGIADDAAVAPVLRKIAGALDRFTDMATAP